MSDTLDKCPHCGFKVKNSSDKVKNILDKLKCNKKLVVSFVIIFVLILVFGFVFSKINLSKSYADKARKYFEKEGYDCTEEYESGVGKVYVCSDKDGDIKHKYSIGWGSDEFFVSKILEGSKLFNVVYNFNSNGMEYTIRNDFFGNWRFSVVSLLNKDGKDVCSFVPEGFSEKDHVTFNEAEAVVFTSDCSTGNKICSFCDKYLDEFNDSLDSFEDLYDELDIELVR